MDQDPDLLLHRLAEASHALVLRSEASLAGLTRYQLEHRIARGDWIPRGPQVLLRAGAPFTKASRLLLATLDAGGGAVVSGPTAAAWWGLPGFDLTRIHITRLRAATSKPALFAHVVHEVRRLPSDQVTMLDGVPVVRPDRLAFELFALAHPGRAARAVDTMWARGLVSGVHLRRALDALASRGRRGIGALRAYLAERPDDWVPPASGLESRFQELAGRANLGSFRRQVDLGGASWAGRVDFKHEELPLVVEVQSERYHAALLDRQHDTRRRTALEVAGLVVVEVWDAQVWHDAAAVVAAVEAGARQARALLAANCHPDPGL